VSATGNVGYNRKPIQVGYRWAGAQVGVVPIGDLTHIYNGEQPVRVVAIIPQPLLPATQTNKDKEKGANNQNR
jgi:hypothetical protein